ncbi:Mor transcription activator family protein [Clostridium perfringens]|uniref:Mor transcription activator family protein n=3 Tax=Clostridium perfringens TaxID=1502 RepID=A0AAW9I1F5_CLOPF|nr:Mor transcription activator family protein [Clostridium perfringens]MCI6457021.1 Mor transcription activator family protein [Clostridium sp.]ATD47289.1 Mor transcription activator family protein [Clostridium perfringens]AXH53801.1 Mor transcription activator family protein [Clostridium perfringens]EDT13650.1 conserved hypothetical protein [Clostridium perfringens E str. JGS1987]EGT0000582.1 Mor transcription activator family protein [Clostridium perfringens]
MDIQKEYFNGVYSTIFEHMGEKVTREIHSVFGGQQFNFPKKLYSKEYVIKYLQENYNGKNVRKLAKELDYSERWVQSIINRNNIKIR